MDKPLVAILIPVYNQAETLGRCLDSVLLQDYPNLVVAALDNQSTDGSYDILLEYEKRFRDRLYTGRMFTHVSPTEHRNRALGLISPRTRYLQYLDPADALAAGCIARGAELLLANERIGCVLTHSDLIQPSGAITPSPRPAPPAAVVPGDDQMQRFMEQGLEVDAGQLYRIEVYRLAFAEGVIFNHFPGWLALVMASSIADFGAIPEPLVHCGNPRALLGEAYIPSVEACFEHYLFLQTFNRIAARLGREAVCAHLPTAILRLGRECVRCAGVLRSGGDLMGTRTYASLALTFAPEIGDTPEFQRVTDALGFRF
jgi:hypothetical protein